MKYKLGKTPSMTAEHNIISWNKVERRLLEHGAAEFELLVSWTEGHKHATGATGFIKYCIRSGWITKA